MASSGCPDRGLLAALGAGLLSGEALDSVAGHLDACPKCLALAQELGQDTDPLVSALCRPGSLSSGLIELARQDALTGRRTLNDFSATQRAPGSLLHDAGWETADSSNLTGAVGSRYRPLRIHAKGGLGEVYVARDEELSRDVALKRIQGPRADDPSSRQRFLREAEITARLEHPGVVPVYGLVTDRDGQPCYAMRFIQGETLQDAIMKFHADDRARREPGVGRLTLRNLLGRFVAVCNTVAYAHSKGVLHRDLKPANIMLGRYGETLVVDWGLAKPFECREDVGPSAAAGGETQTGLALGTPSYMSPEQAAGQWDEVGPAGDVYGLGATLYALLTGQAPYDGNGAEVLEQVRRGDLPPPPRTRRAEIPRPLEAICRKAMERRPPDRYATALELAADVEHWLADEPVTAYREPLAARLARRGRRHKAWVAGALVLLLTATAALAVGFVALKRERDQKELARRQARQALNQLTDETVERLMTRQIQLTQQDREFLRQVLALHEDFARAQGDSPEIRASTADAQVRVGQIRRRLGETAEAEEAYRTALGIQRQLATDFPGQPDYRITLATSHNILGSLLSDLGRPAQAEESFRAAVDLLQKLTADFPAMPSYQRELAGVHNNLGILLTETGRPQQAREAWQAAVDTLQKLTANFPAVPDYRSLLAASNQNLGNFLYTTGNSKEAEERYRAGQEVYHQLVVDFPAQPEFRRDLARSHVNLGILLSATGRQKAAEEALRAAIDNLQKLVAEFPTQPEYRSFLAQSYYNLGELLLDARQPRQTEEAFGAARDLLQQLVAGFPAVPDYRNNLAATIRGLALLKGSGKDFVSARQLLAQALPHHQAALQANPKNPAYRHVYSTYLATLAEVLLGLGEHQKAVATADELVELAYAPARDAYRAAGFVARCGPLARNDNKLTEARRKELAQGYADRAMALLRKAVQHGYKDGAQMSKNAQLNSLHARDDFRRLLQELDPATRRP
jgi:serine/threonine-protein kinase